MSVAPPPRVRKAKAPEPIGGQRNSSVRVKNKALREQVESLKARLEMNEPRKLDDWVTLPQEMRDELAVRALWQNVGDHAHALITLGFDPNPLRQSHFSADHEAYREMKRVVFETAGVKAKLERSFQEGDANRAMTVQRLSQTVATGNDDAAVRAAQVLTKLEGWNKEKTEVVQQTVNLWALTAGAKEAVRVGGGPTKNATPALSAAAPDDPFVILGHEPGAPIKFDTEEEIE